MATNPVTCAITDIFSGIVHLIFTGHRKNSDSYFIRILSKEIQYMDGQKQDRRIRRTQKMLKDSLVELMTEKEFKNISVKDITDRADLNRGTFYLHYSDTYDLLQKMESDVLNDFQEMIDAYLKGPRKGSLLPVLLPIIHYIEQNTKICKILFENTASNDFVNRFHQLISDNGTVIITKQYPNISEVMLAYFLEFVTYGLTGVLKRWIDTGMKEPREQIAEIADKTTMEIARSLLA